MYSTHNNLKDIVSDGSCELHHLGMGGKFGMGGGLDLLGQ